MRTESVLMPPPGVFLSTTYGTDLSESRHRRGDSAVQEAAEAVANSIVRIAARIKQESCDTHVMILGVLPRGDPSGSKRWGIFEDITRY